MKGSQEEGVLWRSLGYLGCRFVAIRHTMYKHGQARERERPHVQLLCFAASRSIHWSKEEAILKVILVWGF